jgi:hypothetical protein
MGRRVRTGRPIVKCTLWFARNAIVGLTRLILWPSARQDRRVLMALVLLLRFIGLMCRGHRAVALENLALRQQLATLTRTTRPHIRRHDRLLWILLAKSWSD